MARHVTGYLLVAATIVACDDGNGYLEIGAVYSTTGPEAEIGLAQLNGAALAAEQINAAGGVLGRQLRLVHRDDGTDLQRVDNIARALPRVIEPWVLGAVSSDATIRLAEQLIPPAVVMSASAGSPSVTEANQSGLLFRTCPSDAGAGALLAERAMQRGVQWAAVIFPETAERRLADAFVERMHELGGGMALIKSYRPGRTSWDSLVTTLQSVQPDAVLLDGNVIDVAKILTEYRAIEPLSSTFWLFTSALQTPSLVATVGTSRFTFVHEGVGVAKSDEHYPAFETAYRDRFGSTPVGAGHSANAYDSVYLAALAFEAGDTTEPTVAAANVTTISSNGTPFGPTQYADAIAAVRAGSAIDYQGASGSLDLDPQGELPARYDLWQVRDGVIVVTEEGLSPQP